MLLYSGRHKQTTRGTNHVISVYYLLSWDCKRCLRLTFYNGSSSTNDVFFWLNYWLESSRDTNTKPPKSLAITGFLVLLIVALTPNKETLYTMVAAHTVQDIATSPEVQKLAGKSLEVINKAMDEYLKGDKPETGEK